MNQKLINAVVGIVLILSGVGMLQGQENQKLADEYVWSKVLDRVNALDLVGALKIDALTWEEKCFDAVEVALKEFDKRVIPDDELDHLFNQFGKHGDRADLVWFSVVAPMLFQLNFEHSPGKNILSNCDKFRVRTIKLLGKNRELAIRFHQFYAWSTYARCGGTGSSQDFGMLLSECNNLFQMGEKLTGEQQADTSELVNLNLRLTLALIAIDEFELVSQQCPQEFTLTNTKKYYRAFKNKLTTEWAITGIVSIYLDPDTRTWKRSYYKLAMFQVSLLFNPGRLLNIDGLVNDFSLSSYWDGYGYVFRSKSGRYKLPVRGWKDDELNYQLVPLVAGYYDEIWDK